MVQEMAVLSSTLGRGVGKLGKQVLDGNLKTVQERAAKAGEVAGGHPTTMHVPWHRDMATSHLSKIPALVGHFEKTLEKTTISSTIDIEIMKMRQEMNDYTERSAKLSVYTSGEGLPEMAKQAYARLVATRVEAHALHICRQFASKPKKKNDHLSDLNDWLSEQSPPDADTSIILPAVRTLIQEAVQDKKARGD